MGRCTFLSRDGLRCFVSLVEVELLYAFVYGSAINCSISPSQQRRVDRTEDPGVRHCREEVTALEPSVISECRLRVWSWLRPSLPSHHHLLQTRQLIMTSQSDKVVAERVDLLDDDGEMQPKVSTRSRQASLRRPWQGR